MNGEKKRVTYLDIAKGVGIIMITYGHVTKLANPIDNFISLIKVPIFFVVAGILFGLNEPYNKMGLKDYFFKLLKSIGVPYVFFSVFFILISAVQSWCCGVEDFSFLKKYLYYTITLRGCTTLWFLPCFIIAEVIFFLLMKKRHKVIFTGLFLVLPVLGRFLQHTLETMGTSLDEKQFTLIAAPYLFISKSIIFVWFILAGYLIYYLFDKWKNANGLFMVIGFVLLIATWYFSKICTNVDVNKLKFGTKPILFFFVSAIGCLGLLLVIRFMSQYLRFPVLTYFGKNSLGLMAVHLCFYIVDIVQYGWIGVFTLSETVCKRYYLETTGILILTLLLSYAVIEIINHYFPIVFGKKQISLSSVIFNNKNQNN
ncbi:MAG: acyltransferase family protein [Lachnospiraceae bacterium]